MKTLRVILLGALAVTAFGACGDDTRYSGTDQDTAEFELEATYISGHYGKYDGCREEAFDPDAQSEGERRPDTNPAPDEAPDDSDGPGGFCEHAQVTIELANPNDVDLTNIHIAELLIRDAEGIERASLPILGTHHTEDNAAFEGNLASGAANTLRIDFRGPLDLQTLLETEDGDEDGQRVGQPAAPLRILIKINTQDAHTLDTPGLDSLPDIAT